jgi:MinD superfamily P-loop ATPase
MKQLVILSGKGGTGKTSVCAAFGHMAALGPHLQSAVFADADVDAANLELLLNPNILRQADFQGGYLAVLDSALCEACGACAAACRFGAIRGQNGIPRVDDIACEGCAACLYSCPVGAISMQEQTAGEWFFSQTSFGPLFHARLHPGKENSGKLVSLIKQQALLLGRQEGSDLVLVDGPPGVGCPVISAASGADLALIVAEPTLSGLHDLERILQMVSRFGVRTLACVNKWDLYQEGTAKIETFCHKNEVELIGHIPFDEVVTEAMVQAQPVTVFRPSAPASLAIQSLWARVVDALEARSR